MSKEKIDHYFSSEKEICEMFGYRHDWRVFPIVDNRGFYWMLDDSETKIRFFRRKTAIQQDLYKGDYYDSDVYTYRHLKSYVYTIDSYTMILERTNCDGNIWLSIWDNKKRIEWEEKGDN